MRNTYQLTHSVLHPNHKFTVRRATVDHQIDMIQFRAKLGGNNIVTADVSVNLNVTVRTYNIKLCTTRCYNVMF